MTTGYNAGIDTSDVTISFIEESVWNTVPVSPTFQYLRLTGEGLAENKDRARPPEIRAEGDSAHAITTQVAAGGNLNFAFSYGTYDAFLSALITGTWSTELAIDSVAATGIITAFDGGTTPLPTLGGAGFVFGDDQGDVIVPGQWIRVYGYGTATDGLYRVTDVDTANNEVQVSSTSGNGPNIVDQDASTADEVKIRGSYVRNGVDVTTFQIEKQFAPALFLNYGGAMVTSGSLSAQVGGFLSGSFNFLAASENDNTSTLSTGRTPTPAPGGRVIDTVTGFSKLEQNDTPVSEVTQALELTVTREGARGQYGIGSASAQGMARGSVLVSGTITIYFLNFTLRICKVAFEFNIKIKLFQIIVLFFWYSYHRNGITNFK